MIKEVLILFLKTYKIFVSPVLDQFFGKGCKFSPTCSSYAISAFEEYGAVKGAVVSFKRIKKCHSFDDSYFYDPVT